MIWNNGKNEGKPSEKIMETDGKIMVRNIEKRTRGQKVDLSCRWSEQKQVGSIAELGRVASLIIITIIIIINIIIIIIINCLALCDFGRNLFLVNSHFDQD